MTPEVLADIHGAAFDRSRPWSAAEFAGLISGAGVFLLTAAGGVTPPSPPVGNLSQDESSKGFLLGRALAGEAEVLTLAVRPEAQGRGIGSGLIAAFLAEASRLGAHRAFLEVAADNALAQRLYARAGFAEAGRRRGYFAVMAGGTVDGIVMARDLPASRPPVS